MKKGSSLRGKMFGNKVNQEGGHHPQDNSTPSTLNPFLCRIICTLFMLNLILTRPGGVYL
jgi:hypothetical protein